MSVLQTAMEIETRSETDAENDISICLKQGQDLENRAAQPHQEFLGVPPSRKKGKGAHEPKAQMARAYPVFRRMKLPRSIATLPGTG